MSCEDTDINLDIEQENRVHKTEATDECSISYDINTKIEAFKTPSYEESLDRDIESNLNRTKSPEIVLTYPEENQESSIDDYTPVEETEGEVKNEDDDDESHLLKVEFETNNAESSLSH